jgi:hypothetical protein
VPAAAVIPAPIAYIKVVAVKKLVVEFFAPADRGWFTLAPGSERRISREVARSAFTGRAGETRQLL